MRCSNQCWINYFSQQPQRKSSMWKVGWAIVCLSFPHPSFLFWHNGTQTPWKKNFRAWGPIMILPCVLRRVSTSAAFWVVNNGNSVNECSLQDFHFSRTKYTLAEAQVSWDSKWGRWTEQAQAETWIHSNADWWLAWDARKLIQIHFQPRMRETGSSFPLGATDIKAWGAPGQGGAVVASFT